MWEVSLPSSVERYAVFEWDEQSGQTPLLCGSQFNSIISILINPLLDCWFYYCESRFRGVLCCVLCGALLHSPVNIHLSLIICKSS